MRCESLLSGIVKHSYKNEIARFLHVIFSKISLHTMATSTFTTSMLYETAYTIPFNWQQHLPADVYNYHSLVWKETNAPVDLHMGVVLPFVSSCLGARTQGLFLTRGTVLNLFWINVAASGVGKKRYVVQIYF